MKNVLNIFVAGANGRMGKQVIQQVVEDPALWLAGASERPESPVLGADAGLNAGTRQASVSIMSDLRRALERTPGVVIDFSSIESTLENINRAMEFNVPIIIGTTGFNKEQILQIEAAGRKIPVMFAPNMSIGMNVTFRLLQEAARLLKEEFEMEVMEIHHRDKVDAPSGTAMKIARVLAEASERPYPESLVYDRHAKPAARTRQEIGMQSIRGGDIVGEHTVYFCANGERIEVRHVATSRATFASGAIRAAKWIYGKAPGLYDMEDVLGIE